MFGSDVWPVDSAASLQFNFGNLQFTTNSKNVPYKIPQKHNNFSRHCDIQQAERHNYYLHLKAPTELNLFS